MNTLKVKVDDLADGAVAKLLQQHLEEMRRYSPPESIHALDVAALTQPSLTFWSAWVGGDLAGCGALKQMDASQSEIKSMRTSKQYLRRGVAAQLLECMLAEAKARSYQTVSLETGTDDAFIPARKLYERFGFTECGPFGDYSLDPFSTYYTKLLD